MPAFVASIAMTNAAIKATISFQESGEHTVTLTPHRARKSMRTGA